MDTLTTKILAGVTKYALYLIVFLTPLFFLPYTIENLELNKFFLFYFLVLVALICWLTRSVLRKTFEIRRTPLDLPILILWALFFLASLLSQERYLSFFGDFSFLGVSFIGLTMMVILYFLVVQNLSKVHQVLTALYLLLIAGALNALYFILRTTKLFTWPGWRWPEFSFTHSSNTQFGFFLVIIFILALALLAITKKKILLDIFFFLVVALSGAALVMLGFKLVWIIMALALFLILVFFLTYVGKVRTLWTSLAFAVLVAALLFVFLGVPRFLTVQLPLEVSLAPQISWSLAVDSLTNNARAFLFGTGPDTFIYDFSKYRPAEFNNNFAWNIRFRQPYNSALTWLATTGVLGSLALLLTILMVLGLVVTTWLRHLLELRRKKKIIAEEIEPSASSFYNSPLIFWGIVASWLTLVIALFLTNFGLVHWLLFWLLLGLMIGAGAHLARTETAVTVISLKTSPQYALATSFGFILFFTAIIVLGIYLGRFFTAEIVFARSLSQPLDQRLNSLIKVINLNPNRVLFHLTLADSYLTKAAEVANQTNDLNQVSSLVAGAVQSARLATEKAPNNVATWEFLSIMYANARPIAAEANNWVINSLERAMVLESTNPTFYVSLANAKLLEKRYSEAKDDLEKAISLKPNLINAYVRLAFLKEAQNDVNGAVAALERGLNFGRQDAGYVFQLGRYYFNRNQKGDDGLAELAYRRALALNPNYSDAMFALAVLYEKTNHKGPALELYRRVLELNPGNKDVKSRIDSLRVSAPAPAAEKK